MKRSFIREILEYINGDTISFAGGLPDETLFPAEKIRVAFLEVLKRPESLQYCNSSGYKPLKKMIADIYNRRGFKTTSENILITSGSQQALDIISRFFQGKNIIVERPSYLGAINSFILNKMFIKYIDIDSRGVNPQELYNLSKSSDLAYLIPDFHNPTGVTTSVIQREKIADICEQHRLYLIEDAPYSELYFEKPFPPISAMIKKQSFHLGSFSKLLAPALRVGWIRADKALLDPLIAYKEAMDLHTNSLSQQAICYFLNRVGEFDEHLAQLRKGYSKKMEYFCKNLDEFLPTFNYLRPSGGMFVYGKFKGVDTRKLLSKCLKEGVIFVPGAEFGGRDDEIRFNFTHSSFEDIEKGVKKIAKILY